MRSSVAASVGPARVGARQAGSGVRLNIMIRTAHEMNGKAGNLSHRLGSDHDIYSGALRPPR
jgi:hypothetical protein